MNAPDALFNKAGYPSDDSLQLIHEWRPRNGWIDLLEYMNECWCHRMGKVTSERHYNGGLDGKPFLLRFTFATGGWSGNESVIEAARENEAAWRALHVFSGPGGVHVFEVKI